MAVVAGALLAVVAVVVVIATRPSTRANARRAAAVASGEKLYNSHCAVCHGRQGEGSVMGPPMFSGDLAALPDEAYRNAIAHGVPSKRPQFGPMPPQPLDGAQAGKVIAYVRQAQSGPGG